jgi:hypothetical protein
MNVKDLLALDKGVKINDITGVFSKISAFKTTTTGKIRQTAVLEDSTGEIQVTIWGGTLDKFHYGSTFSIKEGYIDEYEGAKRITVNKGADVTLVTLRNVKTKSAPVAKKETPPPTNPPSESFTQSEAVTGALAPQKVTVASTDREECKNIMQECIEDALVLINGKGFCQENAVSIINTLYIERCKRIRKDRF